MSCVSFCLAISWLAAPTGTPATERAVAIEKALAVPALAGVAASSARFDYAFVRGTFLEAFTALHQLTRIPFHVSRETARRRFSIKLDKVGVLEALRATLLSVSEWSLPEWRDGHLWLVDVVHLGASGYWCIGRDCPADQAPPVRH